MSRYTIRVEFIFESEITVEADSEAEAVHKGEDAAKQQAGWGEYCSVPYRWHRTKVVRREGA